MGKTYVFKLYGGMIDLETCTKKRLRILSLILIALAILDLITTWIALSMGGFELNPFMRPLIHSYTGVALKLGITIFIAYWLCYRKGFKTLILVNSLMLVVVLNNLLTIYIQGWVL